MFLTVPTVWVIKPQPVRAKLGYLVQIEMKSGFKIEEILTTPTYCHNKFSKDKHNRRDCGESQQSWV